MPGVTGRFEYFAQASASRRSGPCEFSFDESTASVATAGAGPSHGLALSFDLGDIDAFAQGDYGLTLSLYDGSVLRLTQFGRAFETLVHALREAYRARLVKCLLVSDLTEVARFEGSLDGSSLRRPCLGRGEVRLYESNVAFLLDEGGGFQWRLAETDRVEFDDHDYAVVLGRAGEAIRLRKLAKRTGELVESLRAQSVALNERAARALHVVLPFLSPSEFQQATTLMREGACVPMGALRRLHRLIEPTLLDTVVGASRRPYVVALAERSLDNDFYVGWKLIRREAEAGAGSEDEELEPAGENDVDGSGAREDEAPNAEAGAATAADGADDRPVLDVGDGLEALFWFLFPIAKTGSTAAHVAWEATSRDGRATYLFALDATGQSGVTPDAGVAAVNDGLVALNFRRAPVYLPDDALASDIRYRHYAIATRRVPELREVRRRLVGRAIHTTLAAWNRQVERLLPR